MQTSPQLSPNHLSHIYTNYYPKRDADIKSVVRSSENIPSQQEIKQKGLETTCHFQTKHCQKVLDIGCGTCQSLLEINKLGGEAWGLDPDRNSQKVAKKLKLNFHLGTIHDAKFSKNFFDLITASQVLEHENDPLTFLNECKKYLKSNGKIILSFPNNGSFSRLIWGKNWIHWHVPYHLNHFNKKSLLLLSNKAKYKINDIKTVTPNLWTVLQIRNVLSNPRAGKRNHIWDTKVSKKHYKTNSKIGVVNFAFFLINKLLFINRLIDRLGYGDSFVVELSN
jgi:2-polyprenyl-3-methyl-5-hydroxy-6-metoxy-1,4-benzoquinol methylase